MDAQQAQIEFLYTEEEQNIIRGWMDATPLRPVNSGCTFASWVAEMVLQPVWEELPQWVNYDAEEGIGWGRPPLEEHNAARYPLLAPIHLFTINWADTAPGVDWPDAYYATELPGWDIYVVTASQDTAEVWQYTDQAIGYFYAIDGKNITLKAGQIIQDWWNHRYDFCKHEAWVDLTRSGAIDADAAWTLRALAFSDSQTLLPALLLACEADIDEIVELLEEIAEEADEHGLEIDKIDVRALTSRMPLEAARDVLRSQITDAIGKGTGVK